MADIEELFNRINKQAANFIQFFPNEETSSWVSNYGVEMYENMNRTQIKQFLPVIKLPVRRRQNKSPSIRTRSIFKIKENETKNIEKKLKRTASIIASKKITIQSKCNLKTKLRRPGKNESILQDISNSSISNNIKLKKQYTLSTESPSKNIKFQTKNNGKENITPPFIRHNYTEKKINLFDTENTSTTSVINSFDVSSIIFQEDPMSVIEISGSKIEEMDEQFETPILQSCLSEPVINPGNMKKRIESFDDENEDLKKFTNTVSLQTLTPKYSNCSVSLLEESIPFLVLPESETNENFLTGDQFIEEISEALNKCNINNTTQLNLNTSSSTELLEANDYAANLNNSNLYHTQTSTPKKKLSNSQEISGFELLQNINNDSILSATYEINDSTDNIENECTVINEDTKKVSNQFSIKTHVKPKEIDKKNHNHTKKYTKLHIEQLQLEEKLKMFLEKEEQAKKKREALIQTKIKNHRKKREEKQSQAQKVREEKSKQEEERLQLRQMQEEEQQKKKAILIEEKKNHKAKEKKKKMKKRNIQKIPLLPTGDCYDSDDPEGKDLREYYIKPQWAEYGDVTMLKIIQDYLPKKCIKTFFRMPLQKPNLRLLFQNIRVPSPN